MSKKNDPHAIRTGRDAIDYIEDHGGVPIRQSGSHLTERLTDGTLVTIPEHPGDLHKGLRCALIKAIILAGMVCILLVILSSYVGGLA